MNWVVISDELSAVGWRLAGARAVIADTGNVAVCFAQAVTCADLLFVTADLAARLPDSVLSPALLAGKPLIALIDGLPGGHKPPDLEQQVRRTLGIAI